MIEDQRQPQRRHAHASTHRRRRKRSSSSGSRNKITIPLVIVFIWSVASLGGLLWIMEDERRASPMVSLVLVTSTLLGLLVFFRVIRKKSR
jgi:hypothetical protein